MALCAKIVRFGPALFPFHGFSAFSMFHGLAWYVVMVERLEEDRVTFIIMAGFVD